VHAVGADEDAALERVALVGADSHAVLRLNEGYDALSGVDLGLVLDTLIETRQEAKPIDEAHGALGP
jgi:hypothetical protein